MTTLPTQAELDCYRAILNMHEADQTLPQATERLASWARANGRTLLDAAEAAVRQATEIERLRELYRIERFNNKRLECDNPRCQCRRYDQDTEAALDAEKGGESK